MIQVRAVAVFGSGILTVAETLKSFVEGSEAVMTSQTVEAVFEHGVFRPLADADFDFAEGQKVRLVVESLETADDALSLAAQVYDGLTEDQIQAIEQHLRRREDFFGETTAE